MHRGAERGGEELAAEADSEDGAAARECGADQGQLGAQVREFILIVHAHRPAHDDEPGVAAERARHAVAAVDADKFEPVALRAQDLAE